MQRSPAGFRAPRQPFAHFLVLKPNLAKSKEKIHLDKAESRVRSGEEPPGNIQNSGVVLQV